MIGFFNEEIHIDEDDSQQVIQMYKNIQNNLELKKEYFEKFYYKHLDNYILTKEGYEFFSFDTNYSYEGAYENYFNWYEDYIKTGIFDVYDDSCYKPHPSVFRDLYLLFSLI